MLRRLAVANPAKNTEPNVRYSYSIGYEGCDAETCQKNKIMRVCNAENAEKSSIINYLNRGLQRLTRILGTKRDKKGIRHGLTLINTGAENAEK